MTPKPDHSFAEMGFAFAVVAVLITALIVGIGERNLARGCKDFPSHGCYKAKALKESLQEKPMKPTVYN